MRNLTLVPFLLLTPACSFFMGEPQPATEPSATASAAPSAAPSVVATAEPAPTVAATAEPAAPKPSKTFSLAAHGLPLSIDVPEDAEIEGSKSKDGLGGAMISARSGVSLRVLKADARLASIPAAKATLQKLAHKAAKSFSKEEKDLLVYDRGEEKDFLVLVKVGGVTYACQSLGGEPTEAALEPGIAACRSLKKAP